MPEGTDGEPLRRVAEQLRAEFTDPEVAELPGIHSTLREEGGVGGILDSGDEEIVVCLREFLAAIASTLSAGAEDPPIRAIQAALDGAEFVIRAELARGNTEQILKFLPSFVFLVALLVTDQDQALRLSQRTVTVTDEVEL